MTLMVRNAEILDPVWCDIVRRPDEVPHKEMRGRLGRKSPVRKPGILCMFPLPLICADLPRLVLRQRQLQAFSDGSAQGWRGNHFNIRAVFEDIEQQFTRI